MNATNCRGCWDLGNNCGTCPRCVATAPKVDASPAVLAPVDVAAVLAVMDAAIARNGHRGDLPIELEAQQRARAAVEQMAADLAIAKARVIFLSDAVERLEAINDKVRQRAEAAEAAAARLRTELDKMTAQAINAMARLTTQALQEPRP